MAFWSREWSLSEVMDKEGFYSGGRFHQDLKDKEIGMALCRDGRRNSLKMECHEQECSARKTRAG